MIGMRERLKTVTWTIHVKRLQAGLRYHKRSFIIDEKLTEVLSSQAIKFTNLINRYRLHRGMLPIINSKMLEDRDPWHSR